MHFSLQISAKRIEFVNIILFFFLREVIQLPSMEKFRNDSILTPSDDSLNHANGPQTIELKLVYFHETLEAFHSVKRILQIQPLGTVAFIFCAVNYDFSMLIL